MQTFLPCPDFRRSAKALDDGRLPNQVNECTAIYRALTEGTGYRWHPAARMWRGFEDALLLYRAVCVNGCVERGIARDFVELDATTEMLDVLDPANFLAWRYGYITDSKLMPVPPWFGWEPFHEAHQAALVSKGVKGDADHYRRMFGDLEFRGYYWPVADPSYLPHARAASKLKSVAGRKRRANAAVRAFNAHHASGVRIEAWSGDLDGAGRFFRTVGPAYVMGNCPVVFGQDESSPSFSGDTFALTHVRVLNHDLDLSTLMPRMPGDKGPKR